MYWVLNPPHGPG